jgi:hypothetical protein
MSRRADAVQRSSGRAGHDPEQGSGAGPASTGSQPAAVLDDDACRAVAEDIQRQRPEWLVLWGVYSKRFVAFPLFAVRQRVIVIAHYPDALLARLDEVERRLRIQPEQEGNQS